MRSRNFLKVRDCSPCRRTTGNGWLSSSRLPSLAVAAILPFLYCPSARAAITPVSAIGYQNQSDGIDFAPCSSVILQQDVTGEVASVDASWAPNTDGCLLFPYFATGSSTHFLDAISLRFETGLQGPLAGGVLRAFLTKGDYEDICESCASWHQYRLYQGAFSVDDEDCDAGVCVGSSDFPSDRTWAGWIEISVPPSWFVGASLEVSLRLWNARVDAIELDVVQPTRAVLGTWGKLKTRYR